MPRSEQEQMTMDDSVLEDPDLLALLRSEAEAKAQVTEQRAKAREAVRPKVEAATEAGAAVDVHLTGLQLVAEKTYRCGPFEIKLTSKGGTDVFFTTEKKTVFQRSMIATD